MAGDMAIKKHLTRCHYCGKVSALPEDMTGREASCVRCHSHLAFRKTNSISNTWALLITAAILFVAANVYPIMTVVMFGRGNPDTIISGVIHLIHAGQIPIALLVFVASILVPLFKLIGIGALLIAIQQKWKINHYQASVIFRFIRHIGPWSMLDLFMISILVTLVNMGVVATIVTGPGATAFAAVVVVTMLASHSFDQRFIWDLVDSNNE
jgi:paraquat-inducible protein A